MDSARTHPPGILVHGRERPSLQPYLSHVVKTAVEIRTKQHRMTEERHKSSLGDIGGTFGRQGRQNSTCEAM